MTARAFTLACGQAVFVSLALASTMALAHQSVTHVIADDGGFLTGLAQTLSHLGYPLTAFALGLLAGQRGPDACVWTLTAWPVGLAVGLLLRVGELPSAALELASSAMMVCFGLLVALAARLPPVVVPAVGLCGGLLLGAASHRAMPLDAAPVLFALGLAFGGQLIAAPASVLALSAERTLWRRIAVRAVGSWIAAIGLLVLAPMVLAPGAAVAG